MYLTLVRLFALINLHRVFLFENRKLNTETSRTVNNSCKWKKHSNQLKLYNDILKLTWLKHDLNNDKKYVFMKLTQRAMKKNISLSPVGLEFISDYLTLFEECFESCKFEKNWFDWYNICISMHSYIFCPIL